MDTLVIEPEFRSLIPPLGEEEYRLLEESIQHDGCRDALIIWPRSSEGVIVDGHNRYEICQRHGITYTTIEKLFIDMDEARVWIIQNQFGRRNLSPYQRSVLALKLEEIFHSKAREKQIIEGRELGGTLCQISDKGVLDTKRELAKVAHVSHDTIAKVKTIEQKATPEQKARLISGKATVNQVFVQLRREGIREAISKKVDWPTGKYRVIYTDPPWQYSNAMPEGTTKPDDHYPTMPISTIAELPVGDLALDNSVLFLWVPSPLLEDAFRVINAWGFKYKTSFVWDKIKHNRGLYNSIRHEFLLIAVKGSCQPDTPRLYDSVQPIERNEHSAKPEFFRELIDTLYPYGPRIELFATREVTGWDNYGNKISN